MMQHAPLHAACLLLAWTALAPGAAAQSDRLRTTSGATLVGRVTKTTPLGVTLERGSRTEEKPIIEVQSLQFDDEPSGLTQARVNALSGGYAKAIEQLEGIDAGAVKRDLVRQDMQYYKAYARAQLALRGRGALAEAGKELNEFASAHRQSHHTLAATELLGDLLMALGKPDAAAGKYRLLERVEWPEMRARAAVLLGRALAAKEDHAGAVASFERAIQLAGREEGAAKHRVAAELGRAISTAAAGDADAGVASIEAIISGADDRDVGLLADAYNALGACHQRAGRTRESLFAYLHVDLLYSGAAQAHAEALYHLAPLWEAVGRADEARATRDRLRQLYADSRWSKE